MRLDKCTLTRRVDVSGLLRACQQTRLLPFSHNLYLGLKWGAVRGTAWCTVVHTATSHTVYRLQKALQVIVWLTGLA